MRRASAFLAVLASLLAATAVAQTAPQAGPGAVFVPSADASAPRPGLPPRDPAGRATAGTGVLRGRVTAAGDNGPLRRAQVSLNAAEVQIRRSTTTDAEGRYEFTELPAGRYSITVNKGGYVALEYGQRRPFEPGTPVVLSDGQTLTSINIALPRGSVIAGRVSDEFGEPIARAQVQALRFIYQPDGQRRPLLVTSAQTDDLGQFRLYGLMPGEYLVSASGRDFMSMSFGPGAVDTGESYVTSYFPGTPNVNEAEAVPVTPGQESSVQFSLTAARMARVSGTVVDSTGKAATGAFVTLVPNSSFVPTGFSSAQTGTDGSFSLANVAPGDYVLSVQPQPLAAGDARRAESAAVPLTVGGADLLDLRIATSGGATVSGRVVFEGESARTAAFPPRVFMQPVDPGRMTFSAGSMTNGLIADDGTFELAGGTGQVFFRVGAPPAWTLKTVTLEGMDITDMATDLSGRESLTGLTLVLTDKLTDVSGQVTDARGRALRDYAVVVQPADPKPAASLSRYLRMVRPDQDGRFRVRGLPPGRYDATAVESLEQGRQFVPDVQVRLRERAKSFSIREGEMLSLDLRLTTGIE